MIVANEKDVHAMEMESPEVKEAAMKALISSWVKADIHPGTPMTGRISIMSSKAVDHCISTAKTLPLKPDPMPMFRLAVCTNTRMKAVGCSDLFASYRKKGT